MSWCFYSSSQYCRSLPCTVHTWSKLMIKILYGIESSANMSSLFKNLSLKYGTPSANTSLKFKCGEMRLSFYGDLDGAVWSWGFLFIYSATIEPLSCITELMHCDSLKQFLSLFSIVLRNYSWYTVEKSWISNRHRAELDIVHNTIWACVLSFAPLWPVDQSNGLLEAVLSKLKRLELLSTLMVLGRFLIIGQFPPSDSSLMEKLHSHLINTMRVFNERYMNGLHQIN